MRYYLAFNTAKRLRCHVAEADKKTVEVELITGEETEALAKEVINQRRTLSRG